MPGFLGGAAKGLYAYAVRQEDEERKMREKESDRAYQRSENDRIYERNRTDQLQDMQDEAASNPENYTINGDVAEGVIYVRGEPVKFTAPKGSAVYNRALLAETATKAEVSSKVANAKTANWNATRGLEIKEGEYGMAQQAHNSEMQDAALERKNGGKGRGSNDKPQDTAGSLLTDSILKGGIQDYEISMESDKFNELFRDSLADAALPADRYRTKKGALQLLAADAARGVSGARAVMETLAPYIRKKAKASTSTTNPTPPPIID